MPNDDTIDHTKNDYNEQHQRTQNIEPQYSDHSVSTTRLWALRLITNE